MSTLNEQAPTCVRITATYPMMGDLSGQEWAKVVLNHAQSRGAIVYWGLVGVRPGFMGIEHVTFWVDLTASRLLVGEDRVEHATDLLNGLVNDSDVEVHSVTLP